MDITLSFLALLILLPIIIVTVFAILLTDGLPVFYKWNVIGLDKKPFKSWKFRSMIKNADQMKEKINHLNEMDGPVFKIQKDPRILKIGGFLRKYSIDEIPQLYSVLKGDMSIVGPRPAFQHELERYASWQRRKLSIKPGITCLWQINGRNYIKNFDEWVKLDLEYIDNWSIFLDIKIILKTIPVVFRGKGAS
jgi:lipopolysaccharide/colanic/teichoic acid biosynthesis glycosyltransferase